jgi:hypothetical protein
MMLLCFADGIAQRLHFVGTEKFLYGVSLKSHNAVHRIVIPYTRSA